MTAQPTTFQVGATYVCRSFADYDCVWTFEVVRRTRCYVTLRDTLTGDVTRSRVYTTRGEEWCLPLGTGYSLAPVLRANTGEAA